MKPNKRNQLTQVEYFLGKLQEMETPQSIILLPSEMDAVGASDPKKKKTNTNCTNNKTANCTGVNGKCANYESACVDSSNTRRCVNLERKQRPDDWNPHG